MSYPNMTSRGTDWRHPLFYGAFAAMLVLSYQSFIVRYNYGGNWTGLFCTGSRLVQPPSLASEQIYIFPASDGYDGQFYHYMAHDPLFRHGLDKFIDAPRLRYPRILTPALAYLAAAGQSPAIDAAFIAVNLAFLFAGVYWLCRYSVLSAHHPAWGLILLLTPAALVSFDRLTVDLTLIALCVGFALYVAEGKLWKLYAILLLAPLARETGLILTAGYCASQFLERRAGRAFLFSTSAAPALAWYVFVHLHTSTYGVESWFTPIPLHGIVERMIHPVQYPFVPMVKWAAVAFDECALAGMLLAFVLSFWPPRAKYPRPLLLASGLMAMSALNLGRDIWHDAFAFGRVFSPMLVFIALRTFSARSWIPLLPVALIAPRIGLQLAYQFVKAAHALFE